MGLRKVVSGVFRALPVVIVAATMGLAPLLFEFVPYALASYEESRCLSAQPSGQSREQLEAWLFWYSVSACRESDRISLDYLGHGTGECVTYNILGREPILVTVDESSRVKGWFGVYE